VLSTAQLMAGTQLTTMMIIAGMQAMMLPPIILMAGKDRLPNEKVPARARGALPLVVLHRRHVRRG
jgi:hypothetical protein